MSIRTDRVGSLLKEEIGALLTKEYSDPSYGFITVTDVRMTPDLRIARVYVSVFAPPARKARTMAMLEEEQGHIRGTVGRKLRLRYTPVLEFFLDETLDTVDRINTIIRKIHEDERKPDGGEAG
jgi:ribosome-binding factor A